MKTKLVVTTINPPTTAMKRLIVQSWENDWEVIVVGDLKTDEEAWTEYLRDNGFKHVRFLKASKQENPGVCFPFDSYARKNLGYAYAIATGADIIVETDDDNSPYTSFWHERQLLQYRKEPLLDGPNKHGLRWVNLFKEFSDPSRPNYAWPRGFPLELVKTPYEYVEQSTMILQDYPVQHSLADIDPDVCAIYRLTDYKPVYFKKNVERCFGPGVWTPWNSQNTTWFINKGINELMYLPVTCVHRMSDIWRSYVANRVLWQLQSAVYFTSPTVYQERNDHDLLDDYRQEATGYYVYQEVAKRLSELQFTDCKSVLEMMFMCYEVLISLKLCTELELKGLSYFKETIACKRC